jgi:uncharacterized protein YjaZ
VLRRILFAVPLAALAACGGGTPTGSSGAAPPVVVRIDDASGALGLHRTTVQEVLTAAHAQVSAAMPISGVTFTVTPDRARAIGGYGVGGFTPSGTSIEIAIDPAFPDLGAVLPERLRYIAAHELHHARRWRGPGYGRTLLEAMVSEGMADRFAVELLRVPAAPWSEAIPRADTPAWIERARPELDSAVYDHDRWFFGASATVPRWTGYTLGFRLIEAYQASHPGQTAAQLVETPAGAFRP